jgi:hypothetical protein
LLIVTAGAVVAAWAVLYLVVITTAPLSYDPAHESAAKVNREFALLLTLPTALWVTAALVLVDHWWSRTGIRLSAMDPPGRLLAAAVATLPDHRREWGMAMHAELAEVQGRSARWGGRGHHPDRDLRAPGPGRGPVPAAGQRSVPGCRAGRLRLDRRGGAAVADQQPSGTAPRRRRRCRARGRATAADARRQL